LSTFGDIEMEYLIIAGLLIFGLYIWYVNIIGRKNKALESLSGIDVQLRMRSDLIPNVLKIAQKYMDHEKSLLTEITELRTQATKDYDQADPAAVQEHLQIAEKLAGRMGKLMIAVENYPDLKASESMIQAQQTYNEVEARIAAARRFYNASVTALNNSIQIFPGNLLASFASASAMPFYEADEASKGPVDADAFLK
jgi:LemA protein